MKTLFPPYLDVGSCGTHVDVLHAILCCRGYGEGIERDGDYGDMTVTAVKELQEDLGFEGDDLDGNFGPKTRRALKKYRGLDVDAIPFSEEYDLDNTWRSPDSPDDDLLWNGEEIKDPYEDPEPASE